MSPNSIIIVEKKFKLGIHIGSEYQHYKGGRYKVIGIGNHSESMDELVIYQALYDDNRIWARPLEMFKEEVEYEGKIVPRFLYLGN